MSEGVDGTAVEFSNAGEPGAPISQVPEPPKRSEETRLGGRPPHLVGSNSSRLQRFSVRFVVAVPAGQGRIASVIKKSL
jgi:hypothetical protein